MAKSINSLLLLILFFSSSAIPVNYNVLSLGAKPDGITDSTRTFLATWTKAYSSMAATTIYVPPGRLTPHALSSGVSSWSYLQRGSTSSHFASGCTLAQSGSVSEQIYRSSDTSPSGDNGNHVTRPLQHGKWSKGKDGFVVTDTWGVDVGGMVCTTLTIWLQQTEEAMYLCPYQYKSLTLILLIPVSSILNREEGVSLVKRQVIENVSSLLFCDYHVFCYSTVLATVYSSLQSTPTFQSICSVQFIK
ncbi:vacuolar fusion protein CCZ1-like isoform X2 [Melia azedarach]|uniref:Vacuolar fusion protein CCZ1-like isoform X2 n=1 Tax=Melia azedarach TaxID=155640 RepID=A0ACC1YJA4_MELAZ|nr:vacuolar fusion protein CCZ1-like isoform X2 [Melia azedarach]